MMCNNEWDILYMLYSSYTSITLSFLSTISLSFNDRVNFSKACWLAAKTAEEKFFDSFWAKTERSVCENNDTIQQIETIQKQTIGQK